MREHAFFLKDLHDARSIRLRLLENFERASNPHISEEERSARLTFVCVGGGPTRLELQLERHLACHPDCILKLLDLIERNHKDGITCCVLYSLFDQCGIRR